MPRTAGNTGLVGYLGPAVMLLLCALLARTETRVGPLSLGRTTNDPAATSRFDYFRVYRP